MPNYCNWYMEFREVPQKKYSLLKQALKKDKLCQAVMPQPPEVLQDSRNEHKYWNAEKKYREKYWHYWDKETEGRMKAKRPFQQLRYNWNCANWWNKWGICELEISNDKRQASWTFFISVHFWTPRSPMTEEFIRKASEVFQCEIFYEYDEPWMDFSWRISAENWEITNDEAFDDAYFGEWVRCENCGSMYMGTDEDCWYEASPDTFICSYCWDELSKEFSERRKFNLLACVVAEVSTDLEEDDYYELCIEKIYNAFDLSRRWAEFVFEQYNEWVLVDKLWDDESETTNS